MYSTDDPFVVQSSVTRSRAPQPKQNRGASRSNTHHLTRRPARHHTHHNNEHCSATGVPSPRALCAWLTKHTTRAYAPARRQGPNNAARLARARNGPAVMSVHCIGQTPGTHMLVHIRGVRRGRALMLRARVVGKRPRPHLTSPAQAAADPSQCRNNFCCCSCPYTRTRITHSPRLAQRGVQSHSGVTRSKAHPMTTAQTKQNMR
jgi:hypothetical protein